MLLSTAGLVRWLIVLAAAGMLLPSVQAQPSAQAAGQSQSHVLENPAAAGSLAPGFSRSADGTLYLSWLEKQSAAAAGRQAGAVHAFKFARLQTGADQLSFTPARSIASGPDWFANWADMPALYIHSDTFWLAHWLQKSHASTYAYDIILSRSSDQGVSWSQPFSPHADGTPTEHGFVSYFDAADHGVGLVWLDGRETLAAGHAAADGHAHAVDRAVPDHDLATSDPAMTLRTAVVDGSGKLSQQLLLDKRVCDCCQTAAVNTPAGTVIAFRDRSANEIRDIAVMRHTDQGWSQAQIVHADGWQTAACPVNGPALATRGDHVALAWFTMADEIPRVRVAMSTDGAESFQLQHTFSTGTALGRVSLLAYQDGWLLSWMDQPRKHDAAVIRLARLAADGSVNWQHSVSEVSAQRASGVPGLAALPDGRILMAWTGTDGGHSHIHTSVLMVPDE